MIHYYCTIASRLYMYKVLALYNSMVKYDRNFKFLIVCMDERVLDIFIALRLESIELISAADIEDVYPELKNIRKTRSEKEYAWTLKPSVFLYAFQKYDFLDHLIWLDGDTMFLSSADPIYKQWGEHSILLTEEGYSGRYEYMSQMYGVYNTGLMGFKRDPCSLPCLGWFQHKLNEWCYDRMEKGLWSDQMYVNDWPQRFKGVKVIKDRGINMTPFILWRLTGEGQNSIKENNQGVYVGNTRLVLFHYYGFRYDNESKHDICTYKDWKFSKAVIRDVYEPYIGACDKANLQLESVNGTKDAVFLKEGEESRENKPVCCFCTLVTYKYLPKCIALLDSIKKHTNSFHLWICCMDTSAYNLLKELKLENVTLLELSAIEDERLKSVKKRRREHEYCWTLKAPLLMHIFENYEAADSLIYLDSDLFLFSGPEKCFKYLNDYSVYLTCHNFSQEFSHLDKIKGKFNAGIIGFKRCSSALGYLRWWGKKCIEWCYDAVSKGRFADQKYIERFVKSNGSTYVEGSAGVNAAIWNIRNKSVQKRDEGVYIGEDMLVFYHFSSFMILGESEFDLWKWQELGVSNEAREFIYLPYAKAVSKGLKTIKPQIRDMSELIVDTGAGYKPANPFNTRIED